MAAGLGALVARSRGALPLPLWSCPFRHLSGLPCPTCYLTRSAMATLRGDLGEALELHVLGPPLLLWASGLMGWMLVRGVPPPQRLMRRSLTMFVVVGMAYWLLRLFQPALRP